VASRLFDFSLRPRGATAERVAPPRNADRPAEEGLRGRGVNSQAPGAFAATPPAELFSEPVTGGTTVLQREDASQPPDRPTGREVAGRSPGPAGRLRGAGSGGTSVTWRKQASNLLIPFPSFLLAWAPGPASPPQPLPSLGDRPDLVQMSVRTRCQAAACGTFGSRLFADSSPASLTLLRPHIPCESPPPAATTDIPSTGIRQRLRWVLRTGYPL
jgi:hypothetical protein